MYFLSNFKQKQESWVKPLIDISCKEGKEKFVKFEAEFSKKDCKAKWFFRKDVSDLFFLLYYLR